MVEAPTLGTLGMGSDASNEREAARETALEEVLLDLQCKNTDGMLEEYSRVLAGSEADIDKINLPRGDEYVVNSRKQKLHVRSFFPSGAAPPQYILLWVHGYCDHNNQPWIPLIAEEFNRQGVGLITFDFHGHGYSEGVRVDVAATGDLVDDLMTLIFELYLSNEALLRDPGKDHGVLKRRELTCPFFLCGHSLGGLVSLCVAYELQCLQNQTPTLLRYDPDTLDDARKTIAPLFRGCIGLAPAIEIELPDCCVIMVLRNCVLPFFPLTVIPSFIPQPPIKNEEIFFEEYLSYAAKDDYMRQPPGLNTVPLLRFRGAFSILQLTIYVQENLRQMAFPFLVLHDPADKICFAKGTMRLMEESATPPHNKQYIPMPDSLHGLIPNRSSVVVKHVLEWTKAKLAYQ